MLRKVWKARAFSISNCRSTSSGGDGTGAADRHVVRRGSFDITVPTSGELAALHQIEIRNKLKSRGILTYVVPEGTTVKEGDELLRFADEDMRNRIKDAGDAVNTAESNLVTSQAKLDITVSAHQSEIANADLRVMLAELALMAWREGEVVSRRKELAVLLEAAEIDHERAVTRFEDSKELVAQEFISMDEYKGDEIKMIRSKATLEQAKLDIENCWGDCGCSNRFFRLSRTQVRFSLPWSSFLPTRKPLPPH